MSEERAFLLMFYGLGGVGLVGVTTLWFRAWQFGRWRLRALWSDGPFAQTWAVLTIGAFAYASSVWLFAVRKVVRCLTIRDLPANLFV